MLKLIVAQSAANLVDNLLLKYELRSLLAIQMPQLQGYQTANVLAQYESFLTV
ncbi:hypothetical protein cce_1909 [Crocosphaera subtropica ATCC 51142]|uniref:Uncharacterized protein n=1 Tax=Crocosphaera subtropica (strain ATCC 51142 / BH68) TaxID=43989 RepID=B1X0H0_CROS5|nr:hypothetical protein cce_1909 [Crocosphaera subtropica ATCC 51142]